MVQQSRMPKPPSPTLSAIILPEDAAPKIKALLAYWQSIHPAGGGLPGRRHLDPIDIPELLPNIWMIDVKRGPLRFRLRPVGPEIVKFPGRHATRVWLEDRQRVGSGRGGAGLCVVRGSRTLKKKK